MSSKRHAPEQIINKLRHAEVGIANGAAISQASEGRDGGEVTALQGLGASNSLWSVSSPPLRQSA